MEKKSLNGDLQDYKVSDNLSFVANKSYGHTEYLSGFTGFLYILINL